LADEELTILGVAPISLGGGLGGGLAGEQAKDSRIAVERWLADRGEQ